MFCSVQGFRDLVWLPIEQYRKDGRIVRGFQRGTASFGTSTAMAALELTNRMVRTIQVNSSFHRYLQLFTPSWGIGLNYCCVTFSGSSWDGLWHGVSSAWWERHKENKTVLPLRTGSSARWPERRCSQSLYCCKRGKQTSSLIFSLRLHKWKETEYFLLFSSTGHHRHSTDHLRHSHPGARAAWDDGSGGWSSPPAATSSGKATHYGHWSHLQCLGWNEEPDSPGCTPGGVSEMEAGRGVILVAIRYLKTWLQKQPLKKMCWKLSSEEEEPLRCAHAALV